MILIKYQRLALSGAIFLLGLSATAGAETCQFPDSRVLQDAVNEAIHEAPDFLPESVWNHSIQAAVTNYRSALGDLSRNSDSPTLHGPEKQRRISHALNYARAELAQSKNLLNALNSSLFASLNEELASLQSCNQERNFKAVAAHAQALRRVYNQIISKIQGVRS